MYSFPRYRFENTVKHDFPNPFEEELSYFCIFDSGSITGILCLYKTNGPDVERAVLWNPATDAFKVIPQSPLEFVPPYSRGMYLIVPNGSVAHNNHILDKYLLLYISIFCIYIYLHLNKNPIMLHAILSYKW